ncbi:MAG: hypothetical protein IT449_09880 [Phycisphaerales bacterium]|nr:hypothetical protein [Phycisphaerales bacterium]
MGEEQQLGGSLSAEDAEYPMVHVPVPEACASRLSLYALSHSSLKGLLLGCLVALLPCCLVAFAPFRLSNSTHSC